MRQELHVLADNLMRLPPDARTLPAEPALAGLSGVFSVPPMTALQKGIMIGGAALLAGAVLGHFARSRD
jgi:hypothetical protein